MKFSFKDFDYKEFLIRKGEMIGLWTAVGIMALLLIFVIKDLFAGPSASQNAKNLTDLSVDKKRAIDGSVPDPNVKVVPTDIEQGATPQPVVPGLFVANRPFFDAAATEDTKWRLPTVLPAEDFVVRYVQKQVPVYVFKEIDKKMHVAVLSSGNSSDDIRKANEKKMQEKQDKKLSPRQRAIKALLQQRQGMGGGMGMMGGGGMGMMGMRGGGPGMGMMGGGPPGMPGMGMMGGGGMGMMGMRGGGPGMGMMGGDMMQLMRGQAGAYAGSATEYKENWVPYDKTEQESDWAQTMLPYRMVIVTGAFPLKKEMETFQQALRFASVDKMLDNADFEFSGLLVERREAKTVEELEKKEWQLLDVEGNMKVVMMRATGKEPDDQKLESSGVIFKPNRIFMPLPKLESELHKDNKYPEDLPQSIKDTVAAIEKAGKPVTATNKRKSRFDIGSYDLFDEGDQGTRPQTTPDKNEPNPERQGSISNETVEPDKCLVRFVDVAVRPGMVYEYRLKVRMINPNYKKTEKAVTKAITDDPEIIPKEWAVVPEKVKIPDELLYFAADEKRSDGAVVQPDRVPVQVQRWLDVVQSDPKNSSSEVPVGEWSVLERVWAHRGEYIGEWKDTEVPIWVTTMKKFLFAVPVDDVPIKRKGIAPIGPARRLQHKGIPVNFVTGAVLVDFEGGKRYYPVGTSKPVLDEGPVELLVLSPDGKRLLVRNGKEDTDSAERQKHLAEWKSIQEKVKEEVENMKGGGKGDNFNKLIGGSGTK